jgi:tetratricopeptide (TPR) repeat protein
MNVANPFGAHSDVLEAAVPSDAVGRQGLLSELKNRGKAAVAAGQWPDARALYEKALTCCVDDDSETSHEMKNQKAILYANIALVEGKMNEWNMSQHAARRAVEEDASYTKGWWRLGQAQAALHDFEAAVQSLQEASKLEPDNKALQKELNKQKENAQKKQAEDAAKAQQEAEAVAKEDAPSSVKSTTSSKSSKAKMPSSSTTPMQVVDHDEDTKFSKSEYTRGYKIVNGKKTSYFHNELTEEAKKLIGDIAPKKLSGTSTPTATDSLATENKGASAWNKAGTWEERDVTAWAKEALQTQLEETIYTLPESSPAPGAEVKIKKASVSGHASFAVVRGKKRYIYELSADLEWEFAHNGNEANGKLTFPDIDGTCMVGDPYEATAFHIAHSDEGQLRPVLETFVHKQGFRDELHKAIDNWVGLFKETY